MHSFHGTARFIAFLGATALVIAGCGGSSSPRQGGVEIQNADEFVELADTAFNDLVKADVDAGITTISEESRCYFLRADEDDNVAENVYCGPVRSLGGDDEAVWYALPAEGVEQPDEGLILQLPPVDDAELVTVDTSQLFRPDGSEPIDVSAVDEPQAPEAPVSDFATLAEAANVEIAVEFEDLSEPYQLVTPSAMLTVEATATLDVVPTDVVQLAEGSADSDDMADEGTGGDSTSVPFYRPADGQQVRAWRLTIGAPPQIGPEIDRGFFSGNDDPLRDASTSYALAVGSQRLSISGALTEDEGSATIPCAEVQCEDRDQVQYYLIASGSADSAPALVATVDGTDQTLALDTGELTSGVSQVSYTRDESFQQVSTTWGDEAIHLADEEELCDICEAVDYHYGGAVQRVFLSPFAPRKGWAPSGHAWLLVPITDDPTELTGDLADPTIDYSSSWTLKVGGDTISHDPDATIGHTAAFLVDETLTEATFRYSPTGSANLGPDDINHPIEAKEPLTIDISFP